jgi:hypothetical protein
MPEVPRIASCQRISQLMPKVLIISHHEDIVLSGPGPDAGPPAAERAGGHANPTEINRPWPGVIFRDQPAQPAACHRVQQLGYFVQI